MKLSVLIDILVIAVIALCVIVSAKFGFVRTVVEIVGFIAAIAVAFSFATPLAEICYDQFIGDAIVESAVKAVNDTGDFTSDRVWNSFPEIIRNYSDRIGFSAEKFKGVVDAEISSGVERSVQSASNSVVRPAIVKILGLLFSAVILIILMFAVKFLARLLNRVFSFSIAGKLNRMLGACLGLIKGVAVAVAVCTIISALVSVSRDGVLFFTDENISQTVVFKALVGLSPFL